MRSIRSLSDKLLNLLYLVAGLSLSRGDKAGWEDGIGVTSISSHPSIDSLENEEHLLGRVFQLPEGLWIDPFAEFAL